MAKGGGVGKAGIAGDALRQADTMGHRHVLEQLLRALVRVEEPDLEVEDGLPSHAEKEVAGLNDARMHRPHRDLKDAFALNLAELVPLACEWRQHSAQIKIFPQRVHFWPVIVQRAAAGVGMAFELEAEQVLDFTLLPDR